MGRLWQLSVERSRGHGAEGTEPSSVLYRENPNVSQENATHRESAHMRKKFGGL